MLRPRNGAAHSAICPLWKRATTGLGPFSWAMGGAEATAAPASPRGLAFMGIGLGMVRSAPRRARAMVGTALVLGLAGAAQGADRGPFDSNARGPFFDLRADWETLGVHSNDFPFDSDGAGPAGSLEGVVRRDRLFLGAGLFGLTPEIKVEGNFRDIDPLEEKARLSVWAGRLDWFEVPALHGIEMIEDSMLDTSVSVRVGAEGGAVDDLAEDVQNTIHDLLGIGNRELTSFNDLTYEVGVAGHSRIGMRFNDARLVQTSFAPFTYGAVGTDVIEAAGGVQVAFQPVEEKALPFIMQSRTGAYAPMFGGDGLSVFANARVVAHDGLYGGLEEPFVIEAGATAQATFFSTLRVGVGAKCSSKAYEGAPKANCVATFRSGIRF